MWVIGSFMAVMATIGAPDRIEVTIITPASSTPASALELAAPPNAIASGRLVLSNIGAEGSVLHWGATVSATACAASRPVRWLEIEPTFGSLDSGHSASIAVYASSFAASAGTLRAFLCIRSVGVVVPLIEVPIVLTVEDSAVAEP